MKVVVLSIQPPKERWLEEIIEIYTNKIKHFVQFEICHVKSKSSSRETKLIKQKTETLSLLEKINADDYLILCDERGKQFTSVEFSKKFEQALSSGKKRIVIVIGGAFGFSDEIRKRSNLTWSLSGLTFNHLIAHSVILEQLYRAFTIQKKLPYHNE